MSEKMSARPAQVLVTLVVAVVAVVATLLAVRGMDEEPPVPTKQEPGSFTKHFVQGLIDRHDRDGRQATIDYVNSGAAVDDEWYGFIIDTESGLLVGHATLPHRVGDDMTLPVLDRTGYNYGADLMAADEEGRWVDYVFFNADANGRYQAQLGDRARRAYFRVGLV